MNFVFVYHAGCKKIQFKLIFGLAQLKFYWSFKDIRDHGMAFCIFLSFTVNVNQYEIYNNCQRKCPSVPRKIFSIHIRFFSAVYIEI